MDIYIEVFMFKLKSFELAIMPRRFPRTCPVCGRPHFEKSQHASFKSARIIFRGEKALSKASQGVVMAAPRR